MSAWLSFLVSAGWTGVLGYLSWMWAFTLGTVSGMALWALEGSLAFMVLAAVVGWVAGALREAWVIQGKMRLPSVA